MKIPLAAPLAALLATTLAASPQTDDAQALVSTGDILPNGWEIDLIRRPTMSDTGQWAAVLDTTNGTFETNSVLFVNGRIILQEGTTLASGDVIGNIFGVDFSPNGSIAWTHRVNPGTGPTEERLYVDGVETLRSGGPISGAGIPAGTTLDDVLDLRYDAPYVLLEARIRPGGGSPAIAVLLVDLSVPTSPALSMCAYVGQTIAPLPGPITSLVLRGDVASDGTYAFPVSYSDGGTTRGAIRTDQGFFAVHGDPIPGTGWTWSFLNTTYATCSAGGNYLVSASAASGASIGLGVIVSSAGVLAQEGQPVPGVPGLSAGFFDGRWVGMSTAGEPAFVVPQPGFIDTLVGGGRVLLEEGDTVSGRTITSISAGLGERIAVGSEGREFLLVTFQPNSQSALTLVEPEVGVGDPACAAVANSTGAAGTLRALGTSVSAANDLVLESQSTPPGQFGLLLASRTAGFTPAAGGSLGNLCLGGSIGRFNADIAAADAAGVIRTTLDLTQIPEAGGLVAVEVGETWSFQRWYRDVVGGAQVSNYTGSVRVRFR